MVSPTTGLSTHIWNNNLKSIAILVLYPVLIFGMVWLGALILGGDRVSHIAGTPDAYAYIGVANAVSFQFAPLIIAGVAIWFTIAWFFHTSMIRKLSHSHPVARKDEPELYNLVENLCIAQGMPMPKLEIIETHARNAFASGVSDKTFSVTVTRGLMNALAKDELEGVLAHELSHIQNRDVRLLIITVIFTGMFGFLSQLLWSNIRYNLFYSSRRNRSKNGGGVVFAIMVIALILWVGYMASLVMRFALSRHREYMADAGAIRMTKNPEAMMRALMRIAGRDRIPETTDDIAMMCIENHTPFMGIMATHPPIKERIKAISQITKTPIPDYPTQDLSLPPTTQGDSFSKTSKSKNRRKNPWLTINRRK